MAIGTDDGHYHNDGLEYLISTARGSPKKFADAKEINTNQQAGDFESRFNAIDTAPRMPPGASTELAGALKQLGSTKVPVKAH